MKEFISIATLAMILSSCSTVNMVHTQGIAEDVGDTTAENKTDINPQISIPQGAL
jgi:PBP1b-binding outer membrane lipoprotein LpoB